MPFISHTEEDIKEMLATIGVAQIDDLFDEIPAELRLKNLPEMPCSLTEMQLSRLMHAKAKEDGDLVCYIGAGAYQHHIPAAVWDIVSRGEFLTAYTPYQAEASQGTLQLLYEYQTMMCGLMDLDASNASLYEGATSLAEAILLAVRASRKHKAYRILLPKSVHPNYREVVKTIVSQQDIEIIEIPYDANTGCVSLDALHQYAKEEITAVVIPQPNFFGVLENVDTLTNWAHEHNALAIGVVNPLLTAVLKPPGKWGQKGADIACGEGQPLGVPLASGGPYYGFICCKKEFIRQLPGRIVGRTVDQAGKQGFVLTMQAREQHIRRAKATSNICTNQGLLVTASTIYMALLGPFGLRQVAAACQQNTMLLKEKLAMIQGCEFIFSAPCYHEIAVRLSVPVNKVLEQLGKMKIQAGFNLNKNYPELGEALLICVTETKTPEDIELFVEQLNSVLQGKSSALEAAKEIHGFNQHQFSSQMV